MSHNNQLIEQIFFVAKDISSGKEEFYEVNEQYISMISPYIRSSEATNIFLAQLYAVLDKIIDRLAKSSLTIKDEPDNLDGPEGNGMSSEDPMYLPTIQNNNNEDPYAQKPMFSSNETSYSEYIGNSVQANDNANFVKEDYKSVEATSNGDSFQSNNNIDHSVKERLDDNSNVGGNTFESNNNGINVPQNEVKAEPNINGLQESNDDNYIEKMIHHKITQLFLNEETNENNDYKLGPYYPTYPSNYEVYQQMYPFPTSYPDFNPPFERHNY